MKILVALLLSLALSTQAFALNGSGNVSNVSSLSGGVPGTAANQSFVGIPSGVTTFSLYGGDSSPLTAGNFYPFYKDGVQYQVTAGKKAYCFNHTTLSGTANDTWQLISATASFTYGQSSALTGGVYQCGGAAKYCNTDNAGTSMATFANVPGIYAFGASTYAGFQAGNSQVYNVHLDCYEN